MLTVAAVTGVLSVPGAYAVADSDAGAVAQNSPGLLSGDNIQVPVHVPVNVCGNSIDVIGVGNPATDATCVNSEDQVAHHKPHHHKPPQHHAPHKSAPLAPQPVAHPMPAPQLAHTGGSPATVAAGALGAVLLSGGVLLYRRGRAAARR
jgi:hypothetical protein